MKRLLLAGFGLAISASPVLAQGCMVDSEKRNLEATLNTQAHTALASGEKARTCRLLQELLDAIKEDRDMYEQCGMRNMVISSEGLIDTLVGSMEKAKCN